MEKVLILYSERRFTPWRENIDSSVVWRTMRALEREAQVTTAHFTIGRDFDNFVRSFDMVFNLCYGYKDLSQLDVVRHLEKIGAKHTSSDNASQSKANDKLRYPAICGELGVSTPLIYPKRGLSKLSLNGDLLIVKPRRGACHRNISIGTRDEIAPILNNLVEDVLVQQYVPGREFSVAVVPDATGSDYEVLPPVEITSRQKIYVAGNRIGKSSRKFAPEIPNELFDELRRTSLIVHRGFGLTGYSRIDYRLSESGELFVLDVNPMPNLHPKHSFLPNMAKRANIKYEHLVTRIYQWFERYYSCEDESRALSAGA